MDYRGINRNVWYYLHSIYGGGPEYVRGKQERKKKNTLPNNKLTTTTAGILICRYLLNTPAQKKPLGALDLYAPDPKTIPAPPSSPNSSRIHHSHSHPHVNSHGHSHMYNHGHGGHSQYVPTSRHNQPLAMPNTMPQLPVQHFQQMPMYQTNPTGYYLNGGSRKAPPTMPVRILG